MTDLHSLIRKAIQGELGQYVSPKKLDAATQAALIVFQEEMNAAQAYLNRIRDPSASREGATTVS